MAENRREQRDSRTEKGLEEMFTNIKVLESPPMHDSLCVE